jgi:hypothetical protein
VFSHNRQPASIDHQTVIRLNQDTLYSFAVVDISEGAVLALPEHGSLYVSAMIVNEDHFVYGIFHDAGEHQLTIDRFDTDHIVVAVRILVDPTDADDLDAVAAVQDQLAITAASAEPYVSPAFDTASLDSTRQAVLALASGLSEFDRTFGTKHDIDPVRHLIGTAAGWGGLPTEEATYIGVAPGLPVGVRVDRPRCARRRVLVDLGVQRRGLLRTERRWGLQPQQHHGRS